MRPINRIIVHHSAGPDTATVESIRRFHTASPPTGRGWKDIGYHYVVRRDERHGGWLVEAGRPVAEEGAHDQDQNFDSIGVCVLGSYRPGTLPPAQAWWLLVGLVAGLRLKYGIDLEGVEGHCEHEPASTPTRCPGFTPEALRLAVADAMAR